MGTRADFYVGVGKSAEWIGSVAFDGYQWDEEPYSPISISKTEEEFRTAVSEMLAKRKDATLPEMGWPWPWEDSNTTDYAYAFHDGKVEAFQDEQEWPDMTSLQKVDFGERSGLIVVSL